LFEPLKVLNRAPSWITSTCRVGIGSNAEGVDSSRLNGRAAATIEYRSTMAGRDSRDAGQPPSVDEIADELYMLQPAEFTPRRDEHVRDLRAHGERDRSAQVAALRKPSISAWMVNMLTRSHREEIDALLGLGADLRDAQARLRGDDLRALSQQRRQIVNALARQARQLAAAQGRPASEAAMVEVEQTLEAALVDEEAGQLLVGGRLTSALEPTAGFGPGRPQLHVVPPADAEKTAPPGPARPARPANPSSDRRRVAELTKRVDEAEATAGAARRLQLATATELADVGGLVRAREAELTELHTQIEALKQRVHEALGELTELRTLERRGRRGVDEADRAAAKADRALEAARAELDRSTDPPKP
jgi:hypothetical protein